MPRHPPCALHSLSQQRQNNTRSHALTYTLTHTTNGTHQPTPQSKGRASFTHDNTLMRIPACHQQNLHFHNPPTITPHHNNTHCVENMTTRVAKMLASTMQISNNNPTNTQNPPTVDPRQREDQKDSARLILQDPTVCLTPSPTNVRQQVLKRRTTHPQKRQTTRPAPTIPLVNTTIAPVTLSDRYGQPGIGVRAP